MSQTEDDQPVEAKPNDKMTRSSVDLNPKDRAKLSELTEMLESASDAATFRMCLRIVYHQAKFIREQEGNHVFLAKPDGETQVLLPLELLIRR